MFRGGSSTRHLLAALLVVGSVIGFDASAGSKPAAAQEPPVALPDEICSTIGPIPELGGRLCAGFEAGAALLSGVCQQLSLPAVVCELVDATPPDESTMVAYEESWVHRALRLQERLDRHEPLVNTLIPHTHNSANSTAYGPSVSTLDPNQRYSIGDQLRMDIRGIELDLHLMLGDVVLCHGTSVPVGDLVVHVGCSIDMPLSDGLVEVRDFLNTPGNEDVVILLYLENQLEGDPAAHASAVADLERHLGDRVYRPDASNGCDELPMDLSRQDVLDAGAQVVMVGNCGPAGWPGLVFERGPAWDESGYGGDYPAYPECVDTRRIGQDYDANFIRHWEDLTFVSAVAEGEIHHLEPDTVRDMVRCGVDMIGFDRLTPFDGRLEALVWSWAPDEPSADLAESCAYRGDGGRFFTDADCSTARAFACRSDGDWLLANAGPWADGESACADIGATFAVPPTGWENEQLGTVVAAAGTDSVWLNLGNASTVTPPPEAPPIPIGSRLPATGQPIPMLAVLAVIVAVVTARSRVSSAR